MDQVTIVNIALASFGARGTVSSINPSDGSTEGDAASLIYATRTQGLMRGAHWDCLKKQALLTVIKAAAGTPENPNGTTTLLPPIPWVYSYAYPSDCLKARYILPFIVDGASATPLTTAISVMPPPPLPGVESVRFSVAYDTDSLGNPVRVILTNMPLATLVYTANVADPNFWDPNLIEAQSAYLAVWLCNSLTRNPQMLKDMVSISQTTLTNARAMNGNEGITVQDHMPDWIRIRGGGTYSGVGMFYTGWDAVAFPGIPNF